MLRLHLLTHVIYSHAKECMYNWNGQDYSPMLVINFTQIYRVIGCIWVVFFLTIRLLTCLFKLLSEDEDVNEAICFLKLSVV